jgi:hypothetical protein
MGCAKVERELTPYLDGLLKAADERAVEAHLAECPSCRQAVNDMRAARDALHELAAVRAPASLAPRVKAIARAHLERTWSGPFVRQEAWGATLAGAVVLVGVSVMGWYVGRPRPYVAPLTASVAMAPPDFDEVVAVARVVQPSRDEVTVVGRRVRRARAPRREVRLASLTVPAGAGRTATPAEPEDIIAPTESAADEGGSPPEAPAPAAPRPTTMLAALDARLLGMSAGPLTSRSAAVPAALTDALREPRAETDLPPIVVVSSRGPGTGTESPRVAFAGHYGPDAEAPVSFAALFSTQPLPSPADIPY